MALLRGVEQARTAVAPGVFEYRIVARSDSKADDETFWLRVSFDGVKRTAVQRTEVLIVKPENAGQLPVIERMDRREAAAKGLGELTNQETRNAWQGAGFYRYWAGESSADYRPASEDTSEHAFDPRTLGITTDLTAGATFHTALGYQNCRNLRTVGKEEIAGRPVWHVALTTAVDANLDFWIEDTEGYRVHRKIWTMAKSARRMSRTCESEFDPGDLKAVLPKKITVRTEVGGPRNSTFTIETTKWTPGVQTPPPGSLASINLPVGTRVYDTAKNTILGYWDGKALVSEQNLPKPKSPPVPPATTHGRSVWWVAAAGVGLALLLGVVATIVRRVRRR